MPTARELMPWFPAQVGDGYNMSLSPSSFMTSPDTSFSHSGMPGYDNHFATGYSQPSPLSTYSFGLGPSPIHAAQSFMTYTTSPGIYNQAASYAAQSAYSDFYPPVTATLANQMANMAISGSPAGGGGVVFTEQRGIQIRDISRRASGDQIRKMIYEVAGPEVGLVNAIEIPSDKDGNPRGLAFVHSGTADLARRMAKHLNGVEFKGRKLQVRLMKDGEPIFGSGGGGTVVSTGGATPSKPHRGSKHHHHSQSSKDDKRRAERKDKTGGSGSSSGSASKSSSYSSFEAKDAPLVVGGSVTPRPASSSSRSPKGKSKKSSVVIADGSSSAVGRDVDKR